MGDGGGSWVHSGQDVCAWIFEYNIVWPLIMNGSKVIVYGHIEILFVAKTFHIQ